VGVCMCVSDCHKVSHSHCGCTPIKAHLYCHLIGCKDIYKLLGCHVTLTYLAVIKTTLMNVYLGMAFFPTTPKLAPQFDHSPLSGVENMNKLDFALLNDKLCCEVSLINHFSVKVFRTYVWETSMKKFVSGCKMTHLNWFYCTFWIDANTPISHYFVLETSASIWIVNILLVGKGLSPGKMLFCKRVKGTILEVNI